MPKLVLIQTPCWSVESPPYNIALLKAVCEKQGYPTCCLDFNIKFYHFLKQKGESVLYDTPTSWYNPEYVEKIIEIYSDFIDICVNEVLTIESLLLGFTVTGLNKLFAEEMAKRIKHKDPSRKIIFGGPHCFKTEEGVGFLQRTSVVDIICFLEGEIVLPAILKRMEEDKSLDKLPGIAFRQDDGALVVGDDRPLIDNLDELPFSDFSDFKLEDYRLNQLPLSTSRGCINKCIFCSETAFWSKYRFRSADHIFNEMQYQLKKYPHINAFFFNDSLINGNIKMLERLSDLLIKERIRQRIKNIALRISGKRHLKRNDIIWGGQAAIRKEMTKAFVLKLKKAGLAHVTYGVESGSNRILQMIGKPFTTDLACEVIRDTSEAGIKTDATMIVGFPSESAKDISDTAIFLDKIKDAVDKIMFHPLVIVKGTYLYEHRDDRFFIKLEDDFNSVRWYCLNEENTLAKRLNVLNFYKQRLAEGTSSFFPETDYYLFQGNKCLEDEDYQKALVFFSQAQASNVNTLKDKFLQDKIDYLKEKVSQY